MVSTKTYLICAFREPWDIRVGRTWTVTGFTPPAPQCQPSCFMDHSAPGTTPSATMQDDTPRERAKPPRPLKPLFWVPTSDRSLSPEGLSLLPRLCDQNRHQQQLLSSQLPELQDQPDQDEQPLVAIPKPPRESRKVEPRLGAHCASLGRGGASSHQEPRLHPLQSGREASFQEKWVMAGISINRTWMLKKETAIELVS